MLESLASLKVVGGGNAPAPLLENRLAPGRCDREDGEEWDGENRPWIAKTPRVDSIPTAGVMSRIRTMLTMRRAKAPRRVLTLTLALAIAREDSLTLDSTR